MTYFYGDIPRSNGVTRAMDMEYMERRWQTMLEANYEFIVVEGTVVSLTEAQKVALEVHTAAWRYDIGQHRIECLFDPDWVGKSDFMESGVFQLADDEEAVVPQIVQQE